ncbi:MAG: hypothetical protein D6679_07120 [Candidatus Hydrogenedentota bacterium]|nr:MAG: hypothetical protein D6679_07120 [Candidatus Hydrogenedentota bacterium]
MRRGLISFLLLFSISFNLSLATPPEFSRDSPEKTALSLLEALTRRDPRTALRLVTKISPRSPREERKLRWVSGNLRFITGDTAGALAEWEVLSKELTPLGLASARRIAQTRFTTGASALASAEPLELFRYSPAFASQALLEIGRLLAREDDRYNASRIWLELLEKYPDSSEAYPSVLLLMNLGSSSPFPTLARSRPDLLLRAARIAMIKDDPLSAMALLDLFEAVPLEPRMRLDVSTLQAQAFFLANRYEDAARSFRSARRAALALHRDDASLLLGAALADAYAGNAVEALPLFRKVPVVESPEFLDEAFENLVERAAFHGQTSLASSLAKIAPHGSYAPFHSALLEALSPTRSTAGPRDPLSRGVLKALLTSAYQIKEPFDRVLALAAVTELSSTVSSADAWKNLLYETEEPELLAAVAKKIRTGSELSDLLPVSTLLAPSETLKQNREANYLLRALQQECPRLARNDCLPRARALVLGYPGTRTAHAARRWIQAEWERFFRSRSRAATLFPPEKTASAAARYPFLSLLFPSEPQKSLFQFHRALAEKKVGKALAFLRSSALSVGRHAWIPEDLPPKYKARFFPLFEAEVVRKYCSAAEIETPLVHALIWSESGGDPLYRTRFRLGIGAVDQTVLPFLSLSDAQESPFDPSLLFQPTAGVRFLIANLKLLREETGFDSYRIAAVKIAGVTNFPRLSPQSHPFAFTATLPTKKARRIYLRFLYAYSVYSGNGDLLKISTAPGSSSEGASND